MNRVKLFFLHKMLEKGRKKARKEQPWLGRQFFVPRQDKKQVETILYEPKGKKYQPMPVMFNIHGGAWVGGDASSLDVQSQRMADDLNAFVVNINYTKADVKPISYAQEEVVDTVLYFAEHASEYRIDVKKFNLIGYSAGGHICAGAAILLKNRGFSLCSNIPVYPFLDFHIFEKGALGMDTKTTNMMSEVFFRGGINRYSTYMSPGAAPAEELKNLSHTELILCRPDDLYQQGQDYFKHLQEAGVSAELKVFEKSTHGFMESDYDKELNPEEQVQKEQYEACFKYLQERTQKLWE